MSKLLTIKIIGLDPSRYPNVSKNNYIYISYQLYEEISKEWSTIFNDIFKNDNKIRIDQDRRQFIDTWIRDIEEIPHEFNIIK